MSHTAPHVHHINPESLGHPIAPYSNISRARTSDVMFIAGQVGMDRDGRIPADFETQCALVFGNIGAALASQGATFANVVSFTSYLVNAADIPKFADYRTREFPNLFHGGGYPTNTLLVINRLVRAELLLEVSTVAAL